MCGIAGVLSLDNKPIDAFKIKSMCDIMIHRGPDDRGYVLMSRPYMRSNKEHRWQEFEDQEFNKENVKGINAHLALGHVRLAIIDL